ncbi:MAG: hypothetical protein ACO1RX_07150 [Candidatus Sericytochromatia bacterium]
MDALTLRQLRALWQLKLRLQLRFWEQRDSLYRWSMALSIGFSCLLALALAVGVGTVVNLLTPMAVPAQFGLELVKLFWLGIFLVLSVLWVLSPLIFVMKNESLTLDISRLTRYPIAYRTLHAFHSLLALLEPWTLFFYPTALALLAVALYRNGPVVLGPMLVLLLLWIMMHTVWSRLLQDLITVMFTSRWLREFLSIGLILLVILLSFVPALLSERTALEELSGIRASSPELFLYQWPTWRRLQPALTALLYFSPTGWFVHGLAGALQQHWQSWAEGCLGLFAWMSLANLWGVNLLRRLFTEPMAAHSIRQQREQTFLARWRLPGLSFGLRALVLKELRVYFRSLLGKLSFCLTPLLVLIMRVVGLGTSESASPASLVLGMTAYIFMTSLFLYINYFGPDGEGFKLYLLAGIPPRQLIIGKNIALGLFASAEFALVLVLFVLIYPQVDQQAVLFGCGAFVALLMGVLTLGNLLSLRFPGVMDLNQTQYRQSNGTPVLLALQVLSLLALVVGATLWLALRRQESPILLVVNLAALTSLSWWLLLPFSERLWQARRWQILEAVTQRE